MITFYPTILQGRFAPPHRYIFYDSSGELVACPTSGGMLLCLFALRHAHSKAQKVAWVRNMGMNTAMPQVCVSS
jgi:hypothetical protein